jgi:hypothetical protein
MFCGFGSGENREKWDFRIYLFKFLKTLPGDRQAYPESRLACTYLAQVKYKSCKRRENEQRGV